MSVARIVPAAAVLLTLEPEEVGAVILEYLNGLPNNAAQKWSPANYFRDEQLRDYPRDCHYAIERCLAEGIAWLYREGLIAHDPDQAGWYFVTRRGANLATRDHVAAFRRARALPTDLLHPVIVAKVTPPFTRGEYDTAVFQAFKEVEVAVRSAGGFTETDYGVDLMRRAFHEANGPLADQTLPKPEREALGHLFAGSIGLYKNPHSHRHVPLDATAAIELVVLASRLLRIVDGQRA